MTTAPQPSPARPRRHLDYAVLVGAGLLYAIALKYFVLPSAVVLTGTEGIASALSYYFDAYWLFVVLYSLFQLGLLTFAWLKMPKAFAVRSLITVVTVVVSLVLLPEFSIASPEPENERILLVLFGGILAGAAKALAFRRRGSTGDEDIIAAYYAIKHLKPVGHIAVIAAVFSTAFGLLMALLKNGDLAVVINTLMYTCIYIFASAETLNNLYHRFSLTSLDVVTKHHERVGDAIVKRLPHRTYFVLDGQGGRSKEPFVMVRSIVTKEEVPSLLRAVRAADPQAFVYHFALAGVSSRYYIPPIGGPDPSGDEAEPEQSTTDPACQTPTS